MRPVLVLGGTAEARELADRLDRRGVPVVTSLAGRVSDPRLPAGEVRVGGFGGAAGLAAYLTEHRVRLVVDATHPFAADITANAAEACAATAVELVVLRRPPWQPVDGDDWRRVPDLAAAASALGGLGRDAAVFLTTGRQGVAAFRLLPQRFWLRAVEAPEPPDLPGRCTVVLARGPFEPAAEREFLRAHAIEVLVTKNSGGRMTEAKLTAARELGVPVLMVDRPPLPPGLTLTDLPTLLAKITG